MRAAPLCAVALAVATACTATTPAADPSPSAAASLIPQVSASGLGLDVAPETARVDLRRPVFSDPMSITNPLHPTTETPRIILLGTVDGKRFRTEVSVLPDPKTITWDGERIQAVESQYMAMLDGRIEEVALDWYAQDDAGAVWYLGEDVFNYEDGVVADVEGTWQAGRDGPGAMIMPSQPKVGNVYRPENIPEVVFEEVTVLRVGETVQGPRGPISGAIVIRELHMDGAIEEKTFAPGYGEFFTGGGGDTEAVALALPIDALSGSTPAEVTALHDGAMRVYDRGDRRAAALDAAWKTLRARGELPPLLQAQMTDALTRLEKARGSSNVRAAALDVAEASLDFRLRTEPFTRIDLARLGVWARRLVVDATREDTAGVRSDVTVIEWTRDRLLRELRTADRIALDALIVEARVAATDDDAAEARRIASRLIGALGRMTV